MGISNNKSKNDINLLERIKSFYILKDIFSLLHEKMFLNLVIYNKKFQKKLEISIDNYKKISGRILIGGKNEIGKEYRLNTNI